jgi:hypothetical protein
MSESPREIKVVDRRLFTSEGDIRDEAQAALDAVEEAPADSSQQVPAPAPEEPLSPTIPAFLDLLQFLAQTASMSLQGYPDPATGRRQVDLAGAQQIIDALLALKEKTRGRLSFEESDALDGLASELQLVYSRLVAKAVPKGSVVAPVARRG